MDRQGAAGVGCQGSPARGAGGERAVLLLPRPRQPPSVMPMAVFSMPSPPRGNEGPRRRQ